MKLFILSIFFLSPLFANQTHFKLYCLYTPEFRAMYEHYFLPNIKDDFEIVAKAYPQECPSGIYRSAGWEKTMLRKLELLREAVLEHQNDQIFFYSDVDIVFLRPALSILLKLLEDEDFVVQQGWPREGLCAGFFGIRGNEKTLRWIEDALRLLQTKQCPDDQVALQRALDRFLGTLSWKFLPSEQFPNGRRVLKNSAQTLYSVDSEIALDDSIVLFHANCTIGLEKKCHFLDRVLEEYSKRF